MPTKRTRGSCGGSLVGLLLPRHDQAQHAWHSGRLLWQPSALVAALAKLHNVCCTPSASVK
jgi:hypothetical protein